MKQSEFERFDMKKPPMKQLWPLTILTWIISFPNIWRHKTKITKIDMKGVKPPYLLLCNHNAFYDFSVVTASIFPRRPSYVIAIDGYLKREWLIRAIGGICKRKFTKDITVIQNLVKSVKHKDVVVLFPEARYSLCGTNSNLPESLGKLAKLLNIDVVTLIMQGNHINAPFWNTKDKGIPTEAKIARIFTKKELEKVSVEDINKKINKMFEYDDYKWQKKNFVTVLDEFRAKGLHKVLYKCPSCSVEFKMDSDRHFIWCKVCGKKWNMTEYGAMEATEGDTEYTHIPDWYEWERTEVRKEIEAGKYNFESKANVYSLPNAKGFIPLGEATLKHNENGFVLSGIYEGEPYTVEKSVESLYGCHIEYDYLSKYGDCIDLNTTTDTYYISPKDSKFSVTKISLATEELYKYKMEKIKKN